MIYYEMIVTSQQTGVLSILVQKLAAAVLLVLVVESSTKS